jgi:hypothetical protein
VHPARAALLADYWQKTVEKWRFAEMDVSSALNNFSGTFNIPNFPNWYTFAALKAHQHEQKICSLAS